MGEKVWGVYEWVEEEVSKRPFGPSCLITLTNHQVCREREVTLSVRNLRAHWWFENHAAMANRPTGKS